MRLSTPNIPQQKFIFIDQGGHFVQLPTISWTLIFGDCSLFGTPEEMRDGRMGLSLLQIWELAIVCSSHNLEQTERLNMATSTSPFWSREQGIPIKLAFNYQTIMTSTAIKVSDWNTPIALRLVQSYNLTLRLKKVVHTCSRLMIPEF